MQSDSKAATRKIALVTGASSGFGWHISLLLAKNGYNVIITGRRKSKLDELKTLIEKESSGRAYPLVFDITDRASCTQSIELLPNEWKDIDVLINNAGLAAGLSPFDEASLDDMETMIDTNVKGLLFMTKAVLPSMIEKQAGQVINISSTAGQEVYPNGHIYCATKHAVNAITKGMRIDLLKHNIRVGSVSPGLAETEFSIVRFKNDKDRAKQVYSGIDPLHAQDVAESVLFALQQPPHVSIADITITPRQQANSYIVQRKT